MSQYYYDKIDNGLIDPPEEVDLITAEQRQIWQYIPLVRKMASIYSRKSKMGYNDLCQQGYYILADLTGKIDWNIDPAKITSYVRTSLSGSLKKYIAKYAGTIGLPNLDKGYMDKLPKVFSLDVLIETEDGEKEALVASIIADQPTQEEMLASKGEEHMVHRWVRAIEPRLTDREFFILENCLYTDDPMSYREAGLEFEVSHTSIIRDVKRIKAMIITEIIYETLGGNDGNNG